MQHKAERALFELRQSRGVFVTIPGEEGVVVAAVEGLTDERLEQLRSLGRPLRLIITHHRGHAMGLGTANGTAPHLSIELAPDVDSAGILNLASHPSSSIAIKDGQFRPVSAVEAAGLELTRFGRMLPALVSAPGDPTSPVLAEWLADGTMLEVPAQQIHAVTQSNAGPVDISHITEAGVPLAGAEESRFVFFREGGGFLEHVAILIGNRANWPDPLPVRLHSACLTGDLFESLRCDCGAQLRGALKYFRDSGGGVLVYLAQEGRGIGLGNKMRAYELQEVGFDTVDADGILGFGMDERGYDAAVAILKHLGIERVKLLTNNPEKVDAVERGGIEVVERVPLHGDLSRYNQRYVEAKIQRSGHWLEEMAAQELGEDE